MKIFFGFSKKNFSVKKYFKPKHTQEYFDNNIINKATDKVRTIKKIFFLKIFQILNQL